MDSISLETRTCPTVDDGFCNNGIFCGVAACISPQQLCDGFNDCGDWCVASWASDNKNFLNKNSGEQRWCVCETTYSLSSYLGSYIFCTNHFINLGFSEFCSPLLLVNRREISSPPLQKKIEVSYFYD